MVAFALQIRGECRKLTHPLVGLVLAATSGSICALQASHINDPYPGPSIIDLSGCLRIAFLQHATTLGFLLAGVLAAAGTADEAGRGALAGVLIHEPNRRRVAAIKLVTIVLGLLASTTLTTVALLTTRFIGSEQGTTPPVISRSRLTDTLIDIGASLPVFILVAAISLAVALLTRSVIATIAITATVFFLPLTILQDAVTWATPTRWIVEWLHLDPFGAGVDYLANDSVYDRRGSAAFAGGLLIDIALVTLAVATPTMLSHAVAQPNERNT